ncbi:MAG: cadherin-like domain-containing protein, partial [Halobacteriovoraceae bacterium]|nr:cadherin-like domain-containing protein [Halobacteriovoraceae bacterium]
DIDNDFATSCSVTSTSSPGYIKFRTIQGLYIESESDIEDPHSTVVYISSGGALSVTTSTAIPSLRQILVTLGPGSTPLNVASAINGNATANGWVDAIPLNTDEMTAEPSPLALDQVPCSCFGGTCFTQLTPVDNYFGTTDFTYTVTDKDGTSPSKTVKLNITSVNDTPTLTLSSNISATELLDSVSSTTYSASGNLLTNLIVSVSDVEDAFVSNFSFQLVGPATQGTFTLDSFGNYTYRTFEHVAADSVEIRVYDSDGDVSSNLTVPIVITTINDPPIGTLTSLPSFNEDGSAGVVTLTYTDEEGDALDRCVISSVSKVYAEGGCSCAGVTCTATIKGLPDQNGSASFGYKVYDDSSPNPPQERLVSFTITSQGDNPIVFPSADTNQSVQGIESDTFEPDPISFTLDGAQDNDGNSIIAYTLATGPSNGTLTGCLGQGASGLSCTYTPLDGNIADGSTLDSTTPSLDLAQVATDTGTFYASTLGNSYNGLQIELVDIRNTDEAINTLYGANAMAFTNGDKIVILFQGALTTGADIKTAIDANTQVRRLVDFDPGAGVQNSSGTIALAAGVNTMDSFVVQAMDSSGSTNTKTIHISLIPTDDRPTICEYSSYDETTACGLNGCISNSLPTNVTPDADDLVFYSTLSGACYKSSGGSWVPVESSIDSRSINELDPIVIDNIKIDEGGGTSEDTESLT